MHKWKKEFDVFIITTALKRLALLGRPYTAKCRRGNGGKQASKHQLNAKWQQCEYMVQYVLYSSLKQDIPGEQALTFSSALYHCMHADLKTSWGNQAVELVNVKLMNPFCCFIKSGCRLKPTSRTHNVITEQLWNQHKQSENVITVEMWKGVKHVTHELPQLSVPWISSLAKITPYGHPNMHTGTINHQPSHSSTHP